MTGGGELSNADQLWTISEEKRDEKEARDVAYKSILKGLASNIKGTKKRLIIHDKSTGSWMSVRSTTVSGTVLSDPEFRIF